MALYKLFSCNLEVQYRSCLLSKAMLFTLITTLLNIILPFLIAYRSRGFWLKTYDFYEQPSIHFTYNYVLVAETDDPSLPIVCSGIQYPSQTFHEESCVELEVDEDDVDYNNVNDILKLNFKLFLPADRVLTSIMLMVDLDFQLTSTCPVHMQSLGIIEREFAYPASGWKFYGDLMFSQVTQLPCNHNFIDVSYNKSILNNIKEANHDIVGHTLDDYFRREYTTKVVTANSRVLYGHTSDFLLNIQLRVPEMKIRYRPSILQELKWAWPQYLSLVVIFYWICYKIKYFVFNNRLVMAWKDVPLKRLR